VDAQNWPGLLPTEVDGVIDACDQGHAKVALAAWALQHRGVAFVCAGAAGGKRAAERVEVSDLAEVTHDPLLASLRQRLRKQGARRQGRMGLRCVFSRESVTVPGGESCEVDGSLNCAGYGSSVMVTASFGLAAAGEIVTQCLAKA
jgi:tRNA A37 threonylcarbamoyladenosine dehydratase